MKRLRIAVFVTSHLPVPPPRGVIYAPMDIAISLSERLAKKGHRIDFFAPVGSRLPKARNLNLIHLGIPPLRKYKAILSDPNAQGGELCKIFNLWDQYFLSEIYRRASSGVYDLVHIHPIDRALPWGRTMTSVKTVYTLHDPVSPWRAEVFRMFRSENQYLVSISNSQRKPAPDLNYIGTVYNGVELENFPFSKKAGEYLLFAGRIIKEKGASEAIRTAIKAGEKLLIAGTFSKEDDYWKKEIKPYLGKRIKYVGAVPRTQLYKYFQKAKATLLPLKWEEPFGMAMTESMACGTPVIAFNRGSVPEIIVNGKTGFIVKNVNEMAKAIKKVNLIERNECRRLVETKFSAQIMADNYEKIFLELANKRI